MMDSEGLKPTLENLDETQLEWALVALRLQSEKTDVAKLIQESEKQKADQAAKWKKEKQFQQPVEPISEEDEYVEDEFEVIDEEV